MRHEIDIAVEQVRRVFERLVKNLRSVLYRSSPVRPRGAQYGVASHFMCLNSPRDRRDKHLGADFASEHLEEVAPVVQAEEARSPDIEPV